MGGVYRAASGGAFVVHGRVVCSARRSGIRGVGEACVGMGRSVNTRRACEEGKWMVLWDFADGRPTMCTVCTIRLNANSAHAGTLIL